MDYERFVFAQRRGMLNQLNSAFIKNLEMSNVAIAIYGSFERGDLSVNSDIDILIISPKRFWKSQVDLISRLHLTTSPYSIRAITLCDITYAVMNSLTWAFRLVNPLYVYGNFQIFCDARKTFLNALSSVPLSTLSLLYCKDCTERGSFMDPSSAHFYEFKSGAGGFRDFEMVRLIRLWHHLRSRESKHSANVALHSVLQAHLYIALLRHHLRSEFGTSLCSSIQIEGIHHKEHFVHVDWIKSTLFSSPEEISAVRISITQQLFSLI